VSSVGSVDAGRRVKALRQDLAAAFGTLPTPLPDGLVAGNEAAARDRAEAGRLQTSLAGRRWQEITPEEAKECWSAFCYLAPSAYRYYLPALLDAAAAAIGTADTLVHTVTYHLNPSYWHIYYRGSDALLSQRQEALSPAQYGAVLDYLGIVFDHTSYTDLAGAALRHAWNGQTAHPAYGRATERYRALTQWSCPAAPENVRELVACIGTAFAETHCPPLHALCGSSQGDEPAELCLELAGLAWQEIAPEFLDRNSACLSFMTPEGLCYFLPAYMRADAMGLLQSDGPEFRLTHGPSDEHFHPLSPAQRQAVAAYLAFVRERDRAWHPTQVEAIDAALQGYWRKVPDA
jgi:hypothetical protein